MTAELAKAPTGEAVVGKEVRSTRGIEGFCPHTRWPFDTVWQGAFKG